MVQPANTDVSNLGQVALPIAEALGPWGVASTLIGFFAAMFAAAAESALSVGYSMAQLFGWSWGKDRQPRAVPRSHLVCLLVVVAATAFILTSINPIMLTIVSIVLGAAAVLLTSFNDADQVGARTGEAGSA